jgi:hypothetical protein
MQIANPIYDVVFKYLLEDKKIAKIFLATIIEEDILTLDYLPKEQTLLPKNRSFTVLKMDFSAKIKTETGEKQIIIEIKKAKFATDIIRFRRYLGEQYSRKENFAKLRNSEFQKPLPIISIYFLGYKLDTLKNPIIKIKRRYFDGITNEEIEEREKFIECLTHDSYVIQIPYLRNKYRNEVEQLLSVFDQNAITSDNHILNIDASGFPKKFEKIIRQLQLAIAEQEVREIMDVEDEMLEELENLERKIQTKDVKIKEKDLVLKEKEKALDAKDEEIKQLKMKLQKNRI